MCGSPSGPRRSTPCASPPAAPRLLARLRPRRVRERRGARRSCMPGAAARSSTATRRSPATSPATPICRFPAGDLRRAVAAAVGEGDAEFVEATRLATGLLGDSIATNLFMLGYAYQQGLVPVSADGDRARDRIERRRGRVQPPRLPLGPPRRARPGVGRGARDRRRTRLPESHRLSETLDETIARRVAFLTRYQNAAYAARYAARIRRVRDAEARRRPAARR